MYLHNRKLQHFVLKEKDQKVNQIDGSLQSSEIKMNGPQRRVISIIHDGERTGQSLRKITGFQQVNQVGVSTFYFPSIYLSFYFFSLFSLPLIFPQTFGDPIIAIAIASNPCGINADFVVVMQASCKLPMEQFSWGPIKLTTIRRCCSRWDWFWHWGRHNPALGWTNQGLVGVQRAEEGVPISSSTVPISGCMDGHCHCHRPIRLCLGPILQQSPLPILWQRRQLHQLLEPMDHDWSWSSIFGVACSLSSSRIWLHRTRRACLPGPAVHQDFSQVWRCHALV